MRHRYNGNSVMFFYWQGRQFRLDPGGEYELPRCPQVERLRKAGLIEIEETTPEGDEPAGGGATTAGEPARNAAPRTGQLEGTRRLPGGGADLTEREIQILEAMKRVLKEGRVTKDGRPLVEAIEEIVGFDVTAAERDRLMERMDATANH